MTNCLFCKIGKHEIQAETVYENENVMAFLDVHPIAPGHTMVIPKKHAENILDLDNEDIKEVFVSVKKVTKILLQQQVSFTLEPVSAETLVREFPERANYLLQKNKMLEQIQQHDLKI